MTPDREELELLLPWYVNGTLDVASRNEIDAALKTDASLRHALAVAREEQDAVSTINEAIDPPANAVFDRLMVQVKATGRSGYSSAKSSFAETLKAYITSLSPRSLAFASIAVAAVLALQAVTIGYREMQGSGYGLASEHGTNEIAKGQKFIVQFAPGATFTQVTALLNGLDLIIVDGPNGGGFFILALRQTNSNAPEKVLEQLQSNRDVVIFSAKAAAEEN